MFELWLLRSILNISFIVKEKSYLLDDNLIIKRILNQISTYFILFWFQWETWLHALLNVNSDEPCSLNVKQYPWQYCTTKIQLVLLSLVIPSPGRCTASKFTVRSRDRIVLQFIGIGLAFVCDHSMNNASALADPTNSNNVNLPAKVQVHQKHASLHTWIRRNYNLNFLLMSSR